MSVTLHGFNEDQRKMYGLEKGEEVHATLVSGVAHDTWFEFKTKAGRQFRLCGSTDLRGVRCKVKVHQDRRAVARA